MPSEPVRGADVRFIQSLLEQEVDRGVRAGHAASIVTRRRRRNGLRDFVALGGLRCDGSSEGGSTAANRLGP